MLEACCLFPPCQNILISVAPFSPAPVPPFLFGCSLLLLKQMYTARLLLPRRAIETGSGLRVARGGGFRDLDKRFRVDRPSGVRDPLLNPIETCWNFCFADRRKHLQCLRLITNRRSVAQYCVTQGPKSGKAPRVDRGSGIYTGVRIPSRSRPKSCRLPSWAEH